MRSHRTKAADHCAPIASVSEAAVILCLEEKGLFKDLSQEVRPWLGARERQAFVAELDLFRGKLLAHYFVGNAHAQKDALQTAGTNLDGLVEQHCDRSFFLDCRPIRKCLSWRPCVSYADLGDWAAFLMMIKRMQLALERPAAPLVDDSRIDGGDLRAMVRALLNTPTPTPTRMATTLPAQTFFLVCEQLGALPSKRCAALCLQLPPFVEALLCAPNAAVLANCAESLITTVMKGLAQPG